MDRIKCNLCGKVIAYGNPTTMDTQSVKDVIFLCNDCAKEEIEYYTLDVIPEGGSDWDDFGEEYETTDDALDVACTLLTEGYSVKLVEHRKE